jgi:hypothetical protein
VLAGVGKGCRLDADAADWEKDWDMGSEDCGERSDDVVVFVVEKPPLDCEFIEEYGGEVGVRGWLSVFVVWPLALAATSKGGLAGENLPIESRRWRLAL